MVLTALSVIYISTPESKQQGEESLSNSYIVLQGSDEDTNGKKLGQSLVNGLIIVSVIGVMTFVIVLLYKYRCMKILFGYMVLASASLLGILSSYMFEIAVERYNLYVDKLSFALTIWNFAIVGTVSIFFGQSIPPYITQGYLIATSVIVAWQLSHFDPWTAWVLLVLLALYDLFAVLTPCGPLKALVKLMQLYDAPRLPGLLYEANLGSAGGGGRAPTGDNVETRASNDRRSETSSGESSLPSGSGELEVSGQLARTQNGAAQDGSEGHEEMTTDESHQEQAPSTARIEVSESPGPIDVDTGEELLMVEDAPPPLMSPRMGIIPRGVALLYQLRILYPDYSPDFDLGETWTIDELQEEVEVEFPANGWYIVPHSKQLEGKATRYAVLSPDNELDKVVFVTSQGEVREDVRDKPRPMGRIPLALARINKLPVRRPDEDMPSEQPASTEDYTAEELQGEVDVFFPRNGWRIEKHSEQRENEETRYAVIQPDGTIKRILFVNSEGKVFEDLREKNAEAAEQDAKRDRSSIKLGLGDFIFYSILVSKAALYSSTTFFACTVAILFGLGLTLGLLALRGKALPALPISIFLGVVFYLLTRYSMQPWIQDIFIQGSYV